MNRPDIIEWIAVWIIMPPYILLVCIFLYVIEKYEDWRYGEMVEI